MRARRPADRDRPGLVALVLAIAVGAALAPWPGAAGAAEVIQPGPALERSVKAAFLYKFLGYVDFPAGVLDDPAAPMVMAVFGDDDFAAELTRTVAGRNAGGHPLQVRAVRDGDSLAGVHLLFVGGGDAALLARAAALAKPLPLLLVSEAEQGLQPGCVINFALVGGRVRFDVSLEAAERRGLRLSSRLLGVARLVQREGP